MTRTKLCPLAGAALVLVPFVAWIKDLTVLVLLLATISVLLQPETRRAAMLPHFLKTRAGFIAAALALWSLVAVVWSPQMPWDAWVKAFAVIVFTALLAGGLARAPAETLRRWVNFVAAASLGLFTLLLIERVTGAFLIHLHRDTQTREQLFNVLSPGLAFLCCLAFPAAYFLWWRTRHWYVAAGFVLACFVLGLSYRMDAAPLALGIGTIWFAATYRFQRFGLSVLAVLFAVAAVSWGFLAAMAWEDGVHTWLATNVGVNWGVRIEIWNRVHQLILDNAVLGHGFDSARVLAQEGPGHFLHPHNGLLQIWLELGGIGVMLFMVVAAGALNGTVRARPNGTALAVAAGAFGTASTFWLVSFGIWQGWWLAALGLTLAATVLVYKAPARD